MTKHYTKQAFATAIVRAVSGLNPRIVADPCCGNGALLAAAGDRWPDAQLEGVDRLAGACRQTALNPRIARVSTTVGDALHTHSSEVYSRADLILCNPPFCGDAAGPFDDRVDIRFLRMALEHLQPSATLAFVLPASLASNPKFLNFRRALLARITIVRALQLPPTAFMNTEAHTVVLIIRQGENRQPTAFVQIGASGEIAESLTRRIDPSSCRLDPHFYHAGARVPKICMTTAPLKNFVERVRRGYSLAQLCGSDCKALPFLRISSIRRLNQSLPTQYVTHSQANVPAGSILVARVGRHAGILSALYEYSTPSIASDAVLIVEAGQNLRGFVAAVLQTNFVISQLLALRRGMAASLINRDEFLSIRIPVLQPRLVTRINNRYLALPTKRTDIVKALDEVMHGPR